MGRLLMVLLFALSISFAVKPVPKAADENKNAKPSVTVQEREDEDKIVENDTKNAATKNDKGDKDNDKNKTQVKDKTPVNKDDKIIDADSNNVNDQRENDLLKIKQLKSKFQDLLKKSTSDDDGNDEPKKKSKSAKPPKKKTR